MAALKIDDLRIRCTAAAWVTGFDPLPYPPSPDRFNLRASYVSLSWERTELFDPWKFQSACVTGVLVSAKSYDRGMTSNECTHVYVIEQIQGTWLADLMAVWSPDRGDVVTKKVGDSGDVEVIEL